MKIYFTSFLLLLASILLQAQTTDLIGSRWTGSQENVIKLNLVSETFTDVDTLTGVQTLSAGQSTFDSNTDTYYNITNIGILAINGLTGEVLETFPDTLGIKGIEFGEATGTLYASYWDGNAEIFTTMDPVTGVFTDLIPLAGLTLFSAGESTFDQITGRYFNQSPGSINVIDSQTGNVLQTIPTTVQIRGMEYDQLTDQVLGTYWNGSNQILTALDLTTETFNDIGTLTGVNSLSMGESTFDPINRNYYNITNLGITEINADNANINTSIANSNNMKLIEVAEKKIPQQLPVQLISFEARVVNKNQVNLTWKTATELNNDYYLIERSEDAKTWERVEQVAGNGTSSQVSNYELVDKNPYKGVSYYRLSQTDFDGTITYFSVKSVTIGAENLLSVFPNPTVSTLTILGEIDHEDIIQVFDIQGKDTSEKVRIISVAEGQAEIDMENLPEGIYSVRIGDLTQRVLKY